MHQIDNFMPNTYQLITN